ncbi:DUF2147 domain-containing protein [Bradyrhizobium jicamae]|uniref:DUF2147 domain-containing protein n=1 Tax=Bradyrhizobium jicamae TaxID=280332 RepID=A0ABS5FFH5_9BRAD|nr:DUF2147 domain-containing protein [Bradyrhizobium jicamae]MBR0795544.1 DUF2147 domain-containing protein [Bradyrhizobium jicamae]MBR0932583.1 DUF2147 domain-containing protein [Bradyrhizobium jicamae]
MIRRFSLAAAAFVMAAGAAHAGSIDGAWITASGETAVISGGTITLKTGKFAGKTIGTMKAAGDGKYAGTITDPQDDRTYSGSAKLSGATLELTGCAMSVFCKTQTWNKK